MSSLARSPQTFYPLGGKGAFEAEDSLRRVGVTVDPVHGVGDQANPSIASRWKTELHPPHQVGAPDVGGDRQRLLPIEGRFGFRLAGLSG